VCGILECKRQSAEKKVVQTDVISKLGIFRFGVEDVAEQEVSWLVRTKGTESNEGGVATEFSLFASVVFV
jgi:glutathione synthase